MIGVFQNFVSSHSRIRTHNGTILGDTICGIDILLNATNCGKLLLDGQEAILEKRCVFIHSILETTF